MRSSFFGLFLINITLGSYLHAEEPQTPLAYPKDEVAGPFVIHRVPRDPIPGFKGVIRQLSKAEYWKYLQEKRRSTCSGYWVQLDGDDAAPTDLHAFCQKEEVAKSGFIRTLANCSYLMDGKIVPTILNITCTLADCEKGAQVCKASKVTKADNQKINRALRTEERLLESKLREQSPAIEGTSTETAQ